MVAGLYDDSLKIWGMEMETNFVLFSNPVSYQLRLKIRSCPTGQLLVDELQLSGDQLFIFDLFPGRIQVFLPVIEQGRSFVECF